MQKLRTKQKILLFCIENLFDLGLDFAAANCGGKWMPIAIASGSNRAATESVHCHVIIDCIAIALASVKLTSAYFNSHSFWFCLAHPAVFATVLTGCTFCKNNILCWLAEITTS